MKQPKIDKPFYIKGYKFILICPGFPESYEIFKDNKNIGYLRLRWGKFKIIIPDYRGIIIDELYPKGHGEFHDNERRYYLKESLKKINWYYDIIKNWN